MGLFAHACLYLFPFPIFWTILIFLFSTAMAGIIFYLEYLEEKNLDKSVEIQRKAAMHILNAVNLHDNNAQLVKQIDQSIFYI